MSREYMESLEQQLHALHTKNAELRFQNDRQGAEVVQLKERIEQLERVSSNQPIRLITQHLDQNALDSALHLLQHNISAQAFQLSCLQRNVQDSNVLLAERQKHAAQLERQLQDSQLQAESLSHQLAQARVREKQVRHLSETWNAGLKSSYEDRLRLQGEMEVLKQQLSCEKGKNHAVLLDLAKQVASLRQSTAVQTSPLKDSSDFESLSALSRTQQLELQDRNQEIARLNSINGNFNDSGQQHLKNTIKHLRGQLSRYCNLVQHVTEKLALAETTIENYSNSANRCIKEQAFVEKLNEQIMKQDENIRSLEEKLRVKTEEYEKQRHTHLQDKKQLVEAVWENSCFHTFLCRTYGDNFEEQIIKQRKSFEERLMLRKQNEKWVSVEELIQVNEQLRARLKI